MKFFISAFIFMLATICNANEKCAVTASTLHFSIPETENIANIFWQDEKEGDETVKRLHIAYKDGSTAAIKHRFCNIYKFEAAYYMEEKNRPTSIDDIKNKLLLLLPYIAHKDGTQKEAVKKMTAKLAEQQFDTNEIVGASFNGHDPAYGDTGYGILYFPIGYFSLHSTAIYMDMGIGGIH